MRAFGNIFPEGLFFFGFPAYWGMMRDGQADLENRKL